MKPNTLTATEKAETWHPLYTAAKPGTTDVLEPERYKLLVEGDANAQCSIPNAPPLANPLLEGGVDTAPVVAGAASTPVMRAAPVVAKPPASPLPVSASMQHLHMTWHATSGDSMP
jgi:hypothetical protein